MRNSWKGDTILKAACFLAVLLFVYGIFGIVRFAKKRTGEAGLAISVLALLIGIVYLFRPGDTPEVGNLLVFGTTLGFLTGTHEKVKAAVSDAVERVDDAVNDVVEGINEKVREVMGKQPAAEAEAAPDAEAPAPEEPEAPEE